MPAAFDKAVKGGGKVRTISGPNKQFGLKAGEYIHVVFHGGKMERGEVKKKSATLTAMESRHGK
jgi:hypothetical protein